MWQFSFRTPIIAASLKRRMNKATCTTPTLAPHLVGAAEMRTHALTKQGNGNAMSTTNAQMQSYNFFLGLSTHIFLVQQKYSKISNLLPNFCTIGKRYKKSSTTF